MFRNVCVDFAFDDQSRRGGLCQLVSITLTDRLPLSHNEGAHGPPKILTKHSSPKILPHFTNGGSKDPKNLVNKLSGVTK